MCGALPCDWTDDPHHHQNLVIWTLAKIREVTGVGIKPMLTELPDAIASEIERLQAENDDQAHKLLIAGWRKEDDGSVWIPPENEEITRLRGEAEAREAEIAALVESTREAQQLYIQADNESLRLRGEVSSWQEIAADRQAAHAALVNEAERLRGEMVDHRDDAFESKCTQRSLSAEIGRLRGDVERLRAAHLRTAADHSTDAYTTEYDAGYIDGLDTAGAISRQALKGE